MSAEKQVVDYWLNAKGFFTVTNLKAANRDVGILALKFSEGSVQEIWHIEINCSITSSVSDSGDTKKLVENFTANNFNNPAVTNAIRRYTKSHMGSEYTYRKILVLGSMPRSKKTEMVAGFSGEGIRVIEFKDVLIEVMEQLDTQYYKNDVVRSLQLMKYLVLSDAEAVVELIGSNRDVLTAYDTAKVLKTLITKETIRKSFARSTSDKELIAMLKQSSLRQPEKLAKVASEVLGKNATKKFLITLLSQEKIGRTLPRSFSADTIKSSIERKQKPLKYYLKQR
ncbi:hypothetical protein HYV81_02420 [Candidatus Woesearchaeota archaeon]|nr:hypothetical protein [Candidatus Woesearchaeota archaeon]